MMTPDPTPRTNSCDEGCEQGQWTPVKCFNVAVATVWRVVNLHESPWRAEKADAHDARDP
jgi:hypothetical protein